MARCLNNPALLDNAQGKYPEAEPLVKRAPAVREKSLGSDHPDLSRVILIRPRMAGPGSLCKPLRVLQVLRSPPTRPCGRSFENLLSRERAWKTTPADYWEPIDPPKQ